MKVLLSNKFYYRRGGELEKEDYFEKANVDDLSLKLQYKVCVPSMKRSYDLDDFDWDKNCGLNFSFREEYVYQCPTCGRWFAPKNWDGCHVQKAGSTDRSWYIVPLCDSCNQRENEVLDIGDLKMVSAPLN